MHISPNCLLLLARDRAKDFNDLVNNYSSVPTCHNGFGGIGGGTFVVLKFMKYQDKWYREVSTRKYEHVIKYSRQELLNSNVMVSEHTPEGMEMGGDEGDVINLNTTTSNTTNSVPAMEEVESFDNLNCNPANWSTGLDNDGEGFRWYFNKLTYETWWHRPHCLGKLKEDNNDINHNNDINDDENSSNGGGTTFNEIDDPLQAKNVVNVNNTNLEAKVTHISNIKNQINNNNVLTILNAYNAITDAT
jgi:hypothetical protein